jgi:hypothetical protein
VCSIHPGHCLVQEQYMSMLFPRLTAHIATLISYTCEIECLGSQCIGLLEHTSVPPSTLTLHSSAHCDTHTMHTARGHSLHQSTHNPHQRIAVYVTPVYPTSITTCHKLPTPMPSVIGLTKTIGPHEPVHPGTRLLSKTSTPSLYLPLLLLLAAAGCSAGCCPTS